MLCLFLISFLHLFISFKCDFHVDAERMREMLRNICVDGLKHNKLARLFICALWSPAGKELTSWLSFVVSTVSLSLSHWYPGSGVVLDCIDS